MQPAPNFRLADQAGKAHDLNDYRGQWVVLYFYPKDDTPGCTTEACNFRDARGAIAEFGNAVVIGVSKDSVKSHAKFADKHELNFTLLSDPDHKVTEAYDSWGSEGTLRNTYIIDPKGNIVKSYKNVDPKKHVAEIIADLKAFQV